METLFMEVGYNGISLKEISERFNVPYQSVRRRAAKYEWHNKRYREWIKKRYKT
jgi:transposase